MHIVTNEALVNRNKAFATRLFFFSLVVLIGGFILANGQSLGIGPLQTIDPAIYVTIMPIVLLIGFISVMVSVRMTNLWVRVPRPEDAIREGLKGLSSKHKLYNYYHLPARHVLVGPTGVFAIVTRFQDGEFAVSGEKWSTKKNPISRLFGIFRFDGLGNPTHEAEEAAAHVQYIIEDYDPTITVQPVIIFIDPNARVSVTNSTVPILYADSKLKPNFKDYIRDIGKSSEIKPPADLDEFIEEFEYATMG
jgi:hypothetical protein